MSKYPSSRPITMVENISPTRCLEGVSDGNSSGSLTGAETYFVGRKMHSVDRCILGEETRNPEANTAAAVPLSPAHMQLLYPSHHHILYHVDQSLA